MKLSKTRSGVACYSPPVSSIFFVLRRSASLQHRYGCERGMLVAYFAHIAAGTTIALMFGAIGALH